MWSGASRWPSPASPFRFATDARRFLRLAGLGPGEAGSPSGCARRSATTFAANSVAIDARREGVRLTGRVGLPTFSRANALASSSCSSTVAPVRDRRWPAPCAAPIVDFLPPDRHAVAALFVECDAVAGRRQRPPRQGRGALPRRPAGPRPDRRRDPAGLERSPASGLDHRRDGDDPRHAPGPGLSRRVLFAPWDWRLRRPRPGSPSPRRRASLRRASPKPRLPRLRPPLSQASATSPRRSGRRARSCMRLTSSPRPATASSSSTSMPPTSASSMKGSRPNAPAARFDAAASDPRSRRRRRSRAERLIERGVAEPRRGW